MDHIFQITIQSEKQLYEDDLYNIRSMIAHRIEGYTTGHLDCMDGAVMTIKHIGDVPQKPKTEDLSHGLCMEGCGKPATKDYNGLFHWVCDYHYDKLNDEFDDEYK